MLYLNVKDVVAEAESENSSFAKRIRGIKQHLRRNIISISLDISSMNDYISHMESRGAHPKSKVFEEINDKKTVLMSQRDGLLEKEEICEAVIHVAEEFIVRLKKFHAQYASSKELRDDVHIKFWKQRLEALIKQNTHLMKVMLSKFKVRFEATDALRIFVLHMDKLIGKIKQEYVPGNNFPV